MSRQGTSRLLYLQRIALALLVIVIFGTAFFVVKNPANAKNYQIVQLTQVIPVYDLALDVSFQRYLSMNTPFTNVEYVPGDLQPIDSNFTANSSKKFLLRQEAGIQFADMAWHFWNDFKGDKLRISSAYRSNDFQEYMLKKGCTRTRCAQAGTSEHQAGLALDLKVISKGGKGYSLSPGNKYYQWFTDNAHLRGFHNTYQKGIEIDGQMQEGWHRRYVGVGLATELHDKSFTFAEYYKGMKN